MPAIGIKCHTAYADWEDLWEPSDGNQKKRGTGAGQTVSEEELRPEARSAHTLVACSPLEESLGKLGKASTKFVLFGGEAAAVSEDAIARRLSDTWILDTDNTVEGSPPWKLVNTSLANEVPSPRSNHTAFVLGKYMMVYGGWHVSGSYPLQKLEALDLESLSWSIPTTTGCAPSARGNPTSVVWASQVVLFGGWDKTRRYDDVHLLDRDFHWRMPVPHCAQKPEARTDHSAVLWEKAEGETASMIVFGGSTQQGSQNDTWVLNLTTWTWSELYTTGKAPTARTSHAATCVNNLMLVCGGDGACEVTGTPKVWGEDCHLLDLCTSTWTAVVRSPYSEVPCALRAPLCRHTMVTSGASSVLVLGGYNGVNTLSALLQAYIHVVDTVGAKNAADHKRNHMYLSNGLVPIPKPMPLVSQDSVYKHAQSPPKTVALKEFSPSKPAEKLAREQSAQEVQVQAKPSLPFRGMFSTKDLLVEQQRFTGSRLIRALHKSAMQAGAETYKDPATGYSVFTMSYLKKRACCGNKCRHCPWGHKNVPGVKRGSANSFNDDW